MSEIDNFFNFYSSPLFNQFSKLAKPLEDCFGLNDLTYINTTPNGHASLIGNKGEIKNYYLSKGFYKSIPFIRNPAAFSSKLSIITCDSSNELFDYHQAEMSKKFGGLTNFLVLYRRQGENGHLLAFSSTNNKLPLNTIFMNHFEALNTYFEYFLNEWTQYSNKMDSFFVDFKNIIGKDYNEMAPLIGLSHHNYSDSSAFLKKIAPINLRISTQQFTRREKDCIKNLLAGKTARQTAKTLGLSPRTVEFYLDSVKSKIHCSTKSEAFSVLEQYKLYGLI